MITTVVGNYPRISEKPGGQRLRRAIAQFDEGRLTIDQLHEVEDDVTREVIEEQIQVGIDLITDGQIRWDDSITYITRSLDGFELTGLVRYFDSNTYYRQPVATGYIRWKQPILIKDYRYATSVSSRPVKAVITGPYTIAKLSINKYHADFRSFVLNLAQVLNQEAFSLQDAGAPLIQFDEPAIVKNKSDWPLFQEAMAILTKGLIIKTAMYTYFDDVTGLPNFFDLPFNVFGFDLVMGSANMSLISSVPRDKDIALGLMNARDVKLETVEYIVDTINQFCKSVGFNRLYINPNCGLEFLPQKTAYAKLSRMVEGVKAAKEVSD